MQQATSHDFVKAEQQFLATAFGKPVPSANRFYIAATDEGVTFAFVEVSPDEDEDGHVPRGVVRMSLMDAREFADLLDHLIARREKDGHGAK